MLQWSEHLNSQVQLTGVPPTDSTGKPVISVNALSRVVKRSIRMRKRKQGNLSEDDQREEQRWVEEVKTNAADVSSDAAVLGTLAVLADKVVATMTGDGHKMFLQFNLSTDTQPHMQLMTLNENGDGLCWWRQKSMPMGASPSSGVAERHLQMELSHTLEVFTTEEQPYLMQEAKENRVISKFLQDRKQLTASTHRNQAVTWTCRGYTDDFEFMFLHSNGRAYRLKKALYHTMGPGGCNLLLAPKTKFSTQLEMIGAEWLLNFLMSWIPNNKRTKLLAQVEHCMAGNMEVQQYRKMNGLQWWVVGALMMPHSMMNGLSHPLRMGQELYEGANVWVRHRPQMWKQLEKWSHFMQHANGRPVAAALCSEVPTLRSMAAPIFWSSDACTEDEITKVEGMGGLSHDAFWQLIIEEELRGVLHITELEALANVGNNVHLGGLNPARTEICNEVDELAPATTQQTESAKT
jgi:hypothetical protein